MTRVSSASAFGVSPTIVRATRGGTAGVTGAGASLAPASARTLAAEADSESASASAKTGASGRSGTLVQCRQALLCRIGKRRARILLQQFFQGGTLFAGSAELTQGLSLAPQRLCHGRAGATLSIDPEL